MQQNPNEIPDDARATTDLQTARAFRKTIEHLTKVCLFAGLTKSENGWYIRVCEPGIPGGVTAMWFLSGPEVQGVVEDLLDADEDNSLDIREG